MNTVSWAVLAFVPIATISGETSSPAVQPRHGLAGSYYVSTLETHSDVNPSGQDWYVQVWSDPNDFQLPRPFTSPAAVRVDPQIAFGKGKGFVMQSGRRTIWWPTDFPIPAGWTGWRARDPTTKPSDWLAAVIWKGHVHLPKAGTYYFATISNGPAAVYLGQSRVALAGPPYSGILAADAFTYAKDDIQDFVQYLGYGREDLALRARPEGTYVVPVTIDGPRDLPIEVRHTVVGKVNPPIGIDLFWVTPDSPRDSAGKPVAQIVPSDALYVDPPGALEKPTVRGANSMLSADFLYFPAERTDKDVTVTIRLADKDGNPAAGKRVHVVSLVSYGGADAIKQPETPTNESGETTARIRPGQGYKVTHDSTIFATDVTDLVDVAQVAHVTFQAGTVATSFFADSFSPYYDPDLIKVEPFRLMVGRPVTLSVALENRGKQAAELAATFKVNHWNIGATSWTEVGKVEHIQLKPGEARRVSVKWTPSESQTHQCIKVELSGRILWTANRPSGSARPATATVLAQQGAAPQNSKPIEGSVQRNLGPVEPSYSEACQPYFDSEYDEAQTAIPFRATNPSTAPQSISILKDWAAVTRNQLNGSPSAEDAATLQKRLDHINGMLSCLKYFAAAIGHEAKFYAQTNLPAVRAVYYEAYGNWYHCIAHQGLCTSDQVVAYFDEMIAAGRELDADEKLARDPPDSSYQRLPAAASHTSSAYIEAVRKSLERYQGAKAAGDGDWAARQLTAIRSYERRVAESLRREAKELASKAQQLPPETPQDIANLQKESERMQEGLRDGSVIAELRQQLLPKGFSESDVTRMERQLRTLKQAPGLKSARATFLDLSAQKESNADSWNQLSNLSVNSGSDRQSGSAFSQTYAIGNPHDRERTMDLSIRPISVPPDWKLFVVNAERLGSGQAAKPGDAPPKFPVVEREAGKHYAVTLPPKTEITVASVVVPMSEQGAWTTARWAVEGKIGDELVGGIVHELNVPYVVADLKLPEVGSKEEQDFELPPARRLPSRAIVAVSGGAIVLVVLTLVILRRRRRREVAP